MASAVRVTVRYLLPELYLPWLYSSDRYLDDKAARAQGRLIGSGVDIEDEERARLFEFPGPREVEQFRRSLTSLGKLVKLEVS